VTAVDRQPSRAANAPLRATTRSARDTRALGAALARLLRPGDVVLLAGDLGSGKTTLVQGIAAGLGVAEVVTSPTFTLLRPYRCAVDTGVRTLLHADLYRLDHLNEVVDLGLGELVEDDAVGVVEWGDVATEVFRHDVLALRLVLGSDDDERQLTVELGRSWVARRSALEGALARWARP
jgi:tRNA threonylcarbamoyladenosine biosynthesis protein TsaE